MSQEKLKKVLVIEDSPAFADMITTTLSKKYSIASDLVTSYAKAKNLLEQNSDNYSTAIVDVELADSQNGEAINLALSYEIPTLVFTSAESENTREGFWAKGVADYISKKGTYGLEYVTWMVKRLHHNPKVKVLIVDNSKTALQTSRFILKLHCYQVITATSGEEALDILTEQPDIQICLMDCYMKGIGGMETAAKMRLTHNRDELEIIGVSSKGEKSISARYIKSGANDFLLKPFLPEELLCRVNHAAERIESYKKLKKLNELKNQMLGTAAHDIRGPIAAIKTAVELINRGNLSDEQKQSMLKMIHSNSSDTLELLESLLNVSAIESGKVLLNNTDTDLSQLVMERINIYQCQADNKSIALNHRVEKNISKSVDKIKIKEVIDNLITNAIKFSPKESAINIKLQQDSNMITLTVADSGPGVPEAELDKLFLPFSVLSSKATNGEKQTGLGLAIVKKIVDAHNGNIICNRSDSGGASFDVQLPVSEG